MPACSRRRSSESGSAAASVTEVLISLPSSAVHSRTAGWDSSSAFIPSARAPSSGSVRSRSASSRSRASYCWRSSWSGSVTTSSRNRCSTARPFSNTMSSTDSGTHQGDSCPSRSRRVRRLSSRNRVSPRSTVSSSTWWWPPSTATSTPRAAIGAAGVSAIRRRTICSTAAWMSSSRSTSPSPASASPAFSPSRAAFSGRTSQAPILLATPRVRSLPTMTSRPRKFCCTNSPRLSPSASFFSGMIAVCGIGSRIGCRNSAVTANQSASAPTMDASAVARTYPTQVGGCGTSTVTRKTSSAAPSSPVAPSLARRNCTRRRWSAAGSPATLRKVMPGRSSRTPVAGRSG